MTLNDLEWLFNDKMRFRPAFLESERFLLFGTVCRHSYAPLTVSLVLGRSSRQLHVRKTFVAGSLSTPLIPLLGFSRVINSLLTYLLTYLTV